MVAVAGHAPRRGASPVSIEALATERGLALTLQWLGSYADVQCWLCSELADGYVRWYGTLDDERELCVQAVCAGHLTETLSVAWVEHNSRSLIWVTRDHDVEPVAFAGAMA
jgi:hypothetical protein